MGGQRPRIVPVSLRSTSLVPIIALVLGGFAPAIGAEDAPPKAIESQPYKVAVSLCCAPGARIDELGRERLLRDWQNLLRRFVGAPWNVMVEPAASPLALLDPDDVKGEAFAKYANNDKVWLIRLQPGAEEGLVFVGREYDVATRRLGSLLVHPIADWEDAPRELLSFSLELFSPTAIITGQEGGRAIMNVRGAALEPASSIGQVVAKGMVFLPLRLVSLKKGGVQILRIPFTYLQVESVSGPTARCAIVSALSDPFTKRISRPNSLAAIAIKPGASRLRLRFTCKPNGEPASGYIVTSRSPGQNEARELGSTDRSGRITLRPGFAPSIVVLRLIAGRVEPLVEFPIMPGESGDERVIPVDPLPRTVALEASVDALRDQVVDLIALRARLEARMKARLEGEDWDGLSEAIDEFKTLAPREKFAETLTKLKDAAAHEQAETKKAVLTRTAQAELADLQSMIDRYLDDDLFKAYIDALDRGRSGAAKKPVANAAAKPGQPKPTPAPVATARPTQPAAPAPAPAPPAAKRPPNQPRGDANVPF